jgi:hypothetical protein
MRKFECEGYLVEAFTIEQARIIVGAMSPTQRERLLARAAGRGGSRKSPPIDGPAAIYARMNETYRQAGLARESSPDTQMPAKKAGANTRVGLDGTPLWTVEQIYTALNSAYEQAGKRGLR